MAASTFYHRVAPQRAAPGTPAEPAKWDEVISRLLDDDMMTVVADISALILGSSAGGLSEHDSYPHAIDYEFDPSHLVAITCIRMIEQDILAQTWYALTLCSSSTP
jgi:hypothetical protein